MASFIVKVLALSTLAGVMIKYGVPLLNPSPSLGLCLVLLLTPAALMISLFWWQLN